jgi:hypothetical protein
VDTHTCCEDILGLTVLKWDISFIVFTVKVKVKVNNPITGLDRP